MPTPQQALDILRKLSTQPYKPDIDSSQNDPDVQLYNVNNQRADEYKDRIFANQRAAAASMDPVQQGQYAGEVGALKGMFGSAQQDIAESPITAQHTQTEDYRARQRAAVEQGFNGTDPAQTQAIYGRTQAEAKLNQPTDIANIQAQSDLAKQQEASRGALGVAQEQRGGAMDIQKNFADLQKSLFGGGGNGETPNRVTFPGRSGGGGFGFPTNPNGGNPSASLLNIVTRARQEVESAKASEHWYAPGTSERVTAAQAALDQAIGNVFGSATGSNDLCPPSCRRPRTA